MDDLTNYRPVSGLSFLSTLVEHVAAKQLLHHIKGNHLDTLHQSAYKAGHSTEMALLLIKNEIHLSMSKCEPTTLLLLDLSAAFNIIDHTTLVSCLKDWFSVAGSALDWFKSYLTDHLQSIKIGWSLSESWRLLFSIPQGSVLGPLLFSLYTAPLSHLIGRHKGVKFHFYANDTKLYTNLSHKNPIAAFDQLNRCLQDVKEWLSTSKLKLNPNKTEFITFGSKG